VLLSATDTQPSYFGTTTVVITQLGLLDPMTGVLTTTRIPLSTPITVRSGTGIFSGYGIGLIGVPPATGTGLQWYRIELSGGGVTTLGTTAVPTHRTCENWAWWGIAESYGGAYYATYVTSTTQISRLAVPLTGMSAVAPTSVQTFTNLGDMCSITFSTSRNRWYFHHEYNSQFGGDSIGETAGFCPGTFDRP